MTKDSNHPWFRPVWSRVLMVAICAAIAVWDLWNGNYGWALVFGGLGAYAIYIFFIAWGGDADAEKPSDDTEA